MSENLSCPYNKSRIISADKFICDSAKCGESNPSINEIQCPYNSEHFVKPSHYSHHIIKECEQRPSQHQINKIVECNQVKNEQKEEEKKTKTKEDKNHKNSLKKQEPYVSENIVSEIPTADPTPEHEMRISRNEVKKGEGFILHKVKITSKEEEAKEEEKRKQALEEEKKKVLEEERKKDCQSQIF
ncbi:hypothetical protein SteCoe_37802 [Stentor coeruleus]|uniref:CHHC U11-48K-type domain-containing protein n=1 Tax=Stentor coeruleus TaxID=5963 RepID=A0A1R2AMC8_9CILI|nr:hypothetical protein SteCoe_37802 [Stentor coeruleus]